MSKVVLIDSGIGGITAGRQIRQMVSNCYLTYIIDNANFPYGDKDITRLTSIACECVELAVKSVPDLECIVIACNTLTAITIDFLRQKYPFLSFVGTEPAIKQALEYSTDNIMVATTDASAHSDRLKKRFESDLVKFTPFSKLATLIECDATEREISKYIEAIASELSYSFDCIVLGCTHFIHAKHIFERIFVKQVFDGNKGVASRVRSIIGRKSNNRSADCNVILTKQDEDKLNQVNRLLGL